MIWVEETKQSNSSYKFPHQQNVVLDDYGMSFIVITDTWLVSRLLKHVDNDEI